MFVSSIKAFKKTSIYRSMYPDSNHRDGLSEDDDESLPAGRNIQSGTSEERLSNAGASQRGDEIIRVVIE